VITNPNILNVVYEMWDGSVYMKASSSKQQDRNSFRFVAQFVQNFLK